MFGEERLLEVVKQVRHLGCIDIRDRIYEAIRQYAQKDTFRDDLTCIVIKIDADRELPELGTETFYYPAKLDRLQTLRSDLKVFLLHHYTPAILGNAMDQLFLGVNEAATNIIQHGFQESHDDDELRMNLRARPTMLEVALIHNGDAFVGISTVLPVPDGSLESGYGLFLMEKCMDAIHYTRNREGRNSVAMIKNLSFDESTERKA